MAMRLGRGLVSAAVRSARPAGAVGPIGSVRCLSASGGSIDASSMKGRSLKSLADFSREEIATLLRMSTALKLKMKTRGEIYRPLVGKTMAMIFQKRSTRTRVSTETGIARLGGHALFLGAEDIQLGVNETARDTARVLARYNDVILARVYGHNLIEELAQEAHVPIINALSDKFHPLQMLADMQTLEEHYGRLAGLNVAWVGDGNNILNSFLEAAPKMGFHLNVATPKGYDAPSDVVEAAKKDARMAGTQLMFTHRPEEAVLGCDVIVTDTWVSMGMEKEKAQRMKDFHGYQVTMKLASHAKPGWKFLHCLPRKPEEVDDEVFYSNHSLVWDEAENRMWTVMAVTLAQLEGGMDL